jgi:hypothetical protein
MGEAKQKKRAHAAILEQHSACIYCAGVSRATTVEHMPPIQMFRERQRPKGLEFPACVECNNGTSHSDLVASLMGRMYPDSDTETGREELRKLLGAVSNNVPGLLEEMQVGRGEQKIALRGIPNVPEGSAVLRANGPIMTRHMITFGAKLGFALHFEALGSVVPQCGGVQAMYFTNVNAAKGEMPTSLIEMLPERRTLMQGKREVSKQFSYSWLFTVEKRHSVFYAVFNDAFAILAVTALDRSEFLARHLDKHPIVAPGDFKARRSAAPNC